MNKSEITQLLSTTFSTPEKQDKIRTHPIAVIEIRITGEARILNRLL